MPIDRRQFLKASAAAFPLLSLPRGRRRRRRLALVGAGWWGMNILRTALEAGGCTVVGLCDVDRPLLGAAATTVEGLTGVRPRCYGDHLELLDREKPEIVIVATPDHWHALATIAAVEAGAHVYVEKPVSHTIREGRAMVQAARAGERVVQVGTHRRVSPHNRSAHAFLRSGKLGRIGMVRAFAHYAGGPPEPVPDAEPPAGLDWDRWCGPAPLRPYSPRIHPRGFRQYLDFANGQLGDWGVHWLDQILWATGEPFPHTVSSAGDRSIHADGSDAPDHQVATFSFETFTAVWEHRQFGGNEAEKHQIGCYFYGTEGTLHLGWLDGWTFYPAARGRPVLHEEPSLHQPDHQNIRELWDDFLAAIDERRRPVCDIEVGHRATTLSLLGMLSLRLGRSVRWDGGRETIPDDPEATALLSRPYRAPWRYPGT